MTVTNQQKIMVVSAERQRTGKAVEIRGSWGRNHPKGTFVDRSSYLAVLEDVGFSEAP